MTKANKWTETHECRECGLTKDLSEFSTRKQRNGDIVPRNICKICDAERAKKWRELNPEKAQEHVETKRWQRALNRDIDAKERKYESDLRLAREIYGDGFEGEVDAEQLYKDVAASGEYYWIDKLTTKTGVDKRGHWIRKWWLDSSPAPAKIMWEDGEKWGSKPKHIVINPKLNEEDLIAPLMEDKKDKVWVNGHWRSYPDTTVEAVEDMRQVMSSGPEPVPLWSRIKSFLAKLLGWL